MIHTRIYLLIVICVALTIPVSLNGQMMKSASLPKARGSIIRFVPSVVHDSLTNGLKIVFARVNDLPLVEINVIVDAGLSRETGDNTGVAYSTNFLLMTGAKQRSTDAITTELARLGSVIVPYVQYDYAQLYARSLRWNFSASLELLSDIVTAPALSNGALQRLQREARHRFGRQISFGERATSAAVQRICGEGCAMARYLTPTTSEVEELSIEQVRSFYSTFYQPRNTTVLVTGDLEYPFLRTALNEAFGQWENESEDEVYAPDHSPRVMGSGDKDVLLIPDDNTPKGLCYFRIGMEGVPRYDADAPALMVLNSILSEAPSARLYKSLWIDRVVSDNFTSTLAFGRSCNYVMIAGSTSPLLADTVLLTISDLLTDIIDNGVDKEVLEEAKNSIIGNDALSVATNRSVQRILKDALVFGLPVDRLLETNQTIQDVRAEDVRRVAGRVCAPDQWRIAVLGKAETVLPLLEAAGYTVRFAE
ncbi:MAG: insulinase family protein [Bacteroidetes bacterium]|nr:insulinase family protein [Bacteroidota bacterium]